MKEERVRGELLEVPFMAEANHFNSSEQMLVQYFEKAVSKADFLKSCARFVSVLL